MRNVVASIICAASIGFSACVEGAPTQPTATADISSASSGLPNGSFTWVSIDTSRPVCKEITVQVGRSWPIWVTLEGDADSLTLLISESPLPGGFLDDPPAKYQGRRQGSTLVMSRTAPMGGMACPGDGAITPQTGGDLTVTISGHELAGEFRETYSDGIRVTTFRFTFHATI
jgi:hypothetical protein